MKENTQFFVFKLKTGETLFAELIAVSEKTLTIRKPMIVVDNNSGTESQMMAQMWLPFVADDSNIPIPINMIYLFEPLADKFIKFYGSILMQSEIQRIREEAVADFDKHDKINYYEMLAAVTKINELSEYMSDKFGIDRVDTSQFMNAAEERKPVTH